MANFYSLNVHGILSVTDNIKSSSPTASTIYAHYITAYGSYSGASYAFGFRIFTRSSGALTSWAAIWAAIGSVRTAISLDSGVYYASISNCGYLPVIRIMSATQAAFPCCMPACGGSSGNMQFWTPNGQMLNLSKVVTVSGFTISDSVVSFSI